MTARCAWCGKALNRRKPAPHEQQPRLHLCRDHERHRAELEEAKAAGRRLIDRAKP